MTGYWKNKKLSYSHKLKIKKSLAKVKKQRSFIIKELFRTKKIKPYWKGKHFPLSIRKKISKSCKKTMNTYWFRKKKSQQLKKYWAEHQNVRKAVKQYWKNHPNLKKEAAQKMQIYYKTHEEARKKLLKNQKNPFSPKLKTKQGFKVRSQGEQIIANCLYNMNIKSEYESKVLFFKTDTSIPDFYLPNQKRFIEFYGGHPKAWKKKVIKNKLYKAYKIPVITITPAELKNIRDVLERELRKSI